MSQCLEATELNPHQSAYRKHHSTAVHSRSSHKCNRLTETILSIYFLDHSCAFDTVDHDILITRLSSWFGIHGSVLNWFKSYLSSRIFRVKCDNYFSSSCACIYGVPKGSVLGPLLFFMYTSPFSTFISSLSLNCHLYADDTTLLYFLPPDFDSSVTHLRNALQHISSWMTANLLTLNSSTTEFLLISLPTTTR